MRQLFYKLALSTALISGAAAVAQADCSSKTVSTDTTASFQLAQAGGGSGSGGSGGTTGNTGGGTGAGTNPGSTSGTSPNSTSGGGAAVPIIPQDQPMRAPGTPGTPPQPGTGTGTNTGQTNR